MAVYQHPTLLEALTRDRVAEFRRSAEATGDSRRAKRRHNVVETARRGTGWLLVDLGLRLAMPRGGTNGPVARGQR
jgi:hypothetical protein